MKILTGYFSLLTGYFSLLPVTSGYFTLLLVPPFSMNANRVKNVDSGKCIFLIHSIEINMTSFFILTSPF